jgi:hypothetical protein
MRATKFTGKVVAATMGVALAGAVAAPAAGAASSAGRIRDKLVVDAKSLPESPNLSPWKIAAKYDRKDVESTFRPKACKTYLKAYKSSEKVSKASPTFHNDDPKTGTVLAANRVSVFNSTKAAKSYMKVVTASGMSDCVQAWIGQWAEDRDLTATDISVDHERAAAGKKWSDGGIGYRAEMRISHLQDDVDTPDSLYFDDIYLRSGKVVLEYLFVAEDGPYPDGSYFAADEMKVLRKLQK